MQKFWFSFKIFRFKRFIHIYLFIVTGFTFDTPPHLKYLVTFYEHSTNPFCILSTGAYKACNVKSLIISIFSLSVSFTRWWNICVWAEMRKHSWTQIITHKIITCWVIRWKISVHCTLFHYNIKLWSNASTWKSSVSFRTIKLVCFMKIYQCHISTHTKKCSLF